MAGLSRLEQETIITFNNAEDEANIYSTAPSWITKIKKLGGKEDGAGYSVDVPKGFITIRKPVKRTAAQKQAYRKSLAKARATNK